MSYWTNEDIEAILIQLNDRKLPFEDYAFSALGEGLNLLGRGSSAYVYEAVSRGKKKEKESERQREKEKRAIKVIGFGNRHVDPKAFRDSVDAQRDLALSEKTVVKAFSSVMVRVWIRGEHDVVRAEEIDLYADHKPEGEYLDLQFILMEKLCPVLFMDGLTHTLTPRRLGTYDEKELLKLAYDIAEAIDKAHKGKLIHRDIKPENIFYDPFSECYKLGDFGIAKETPDGMASTVAFTKGYGAPEVVGTLEDRYDQTADIYSFGMSLYVLMNEIRFPGSSNYRPNIHQYTQGYVPPEPVNGSEEFARIVLKMISFDPDDRYQSMEAVINDLDKLKYGHRVKYLREHKSIPLALGTVFALMGASVWKLSFMPDLQLSFSVWGYIFCALCVLKSVMYMYRKKTGYVTAIIFGVGIYLLFATGFVWWKLLLLIFMSFLWNYWQGIMAGGALAANVTFLIMKEYGLSVSAYSEYRWVTVLLLSLSVLLLICHSMQVEKDEWIIKVYLEKNLNWIMAAGVYLSLILIAKGAALQGPVMAGLREKIFGSAAVLWIMTWDPQKVGIWGAVFCVIWMLRVRVLSYFQKIKEKPDA